MTDRSGHKTAIIERKVESILQKRLYLSGVLYPIQQQLLKRHCYALFSPISTYILPRISKKINCIRII